jgi:hypothetical protein
MPTSMYRPVTLMPNSSDESHGLPAGFSGGYMDDPAAIWIHSEKAGCRHPSATFALPWPHCPGLTIACMLIGLARLSALPLIQNL